MANDGGPKLKAKTFLQVSLDQMAYPETPLGSVPDGDHISKAEKELLVYLNKWCNSGGWCPLDDVQLAKALGWRCDNDRARRCRAQSLLNGRKIRDVFRPGLTHEGRAFIEVEYDDPANRKGRRIRTTWKWRELMERHRVTTDAGGNGQAAPSREEHQVAEPPASAVPHPAIAKAAAIALAHILPREEGQALAEQILEGAGAFTHPERLPDGVWYAADPLQKGKIRDVYTWLEGCDRKGGVGPIKAKAARRRVLNRDKPAAKVISASEPVTPPSTEEIALWTDRLNIPGLQSSALAFFNLAGLPIPDHGKALPPQPAACPSAPPPST